MKRPRALRKKAEMVKHFRTSGETLPVFGAGGAKSYDGTGQYVSAAHSGDEGRILGI